MVMLFSAVVEKNYEKMIATICRDTNLAEVVVTQIEGDRIVPAETLKEVFERYTAVPVTAVPDIREAFRLAREKKGRRNPLLCRFPVFGWGIEGILKEEQRSQTEGS